MSKSDMLPPKLTLVKCGNAISLDDLQLLQKRLMLTFPADYSQFLQTCNGGQPKPNEFRMKRLRDGKECGGMIEWFYVANSTNDWNDLEREYRSYSYRLQPGFLPIAHDPGGNQICLILEGKHAGKVLFWDSDGAPERYLDYGLEHPEDQLWHIAGSLQDFLRCLHEPST
jgi:cell wall assembly regulator SMI1